MKLTSSRDPVLSADSLFAHLPRVEGRLLTGADLFSLTNNLERAVREGSNEMVRSHGAPRAATIFSNVQGSIEHVVDGTIPTSRTWNAICDTLRTTLMNNFYAVNRSEFRLEQETEQRQRRSLNRDERNALRSPLGEDSLEAMRTGVALLNVIDRKLAPDPARTALLTMVSSNLSGYFAKYAQVG